MNTFGANRALAAVAVAVIALAGACSSSSKTISASGAIDPSTIAPGDGVFSRSLGGTLDLKVAGAVTGAWQGATPLRIVHSVSGAVPREGWLLSVGLEEPVAAGPGLKVRPAFDIVGYKGDGEYRVAAKEKGGGEPADSGDSDGEAIASALMSTAFLVVNRDGAAESRNYELVQEPCTVVVAKQGLSGSVDCPANTDTQGSVAFRWSWKADPAQILQEDSTPAGSSFDEPTVEPGVPTTTADDAGPLPEPTMRGDLKMTVSLKDECVTIGGTVDVTIETEPEADLTLATAFSDARPHGLYELGTADAAGRYRWSFVVPPDAPPGNAYVLVAANEAEGDRSAGATNPFKVEAVKC